MLSDYSEWWLAVALLAGLGLVLSPIFAEMSAAFRFIEFMERGFR